jgi:hypothetical protein
VSPAFNAFSKKLDNHIHALALNFVFYNFTRIHKTLRMSPAMAAGITDRLWSLDDVIAKIDELAPAPKPRGNYGDRCNNPQTHADYRIGSHDAECQGGSCGGTMPSALDSPFRHQVNLGGFTPVTGIVPYNFR